MWAPAGSYRVARIRGLRKANRNHIALYKCDMPYIKCCSGNPAYMGRLTDATYSRHVWITRYCTVLDGAIRGFNP